MAIMPDRLKLPDSKYDGTGDPADHLENYRSWMELNSATNAFKWTISSFCQLSESFISQFSVHKIHRKSARHLYTITQQENETTESYLTHFVKEEMNVQDRNAENASNLDASKLSQDILLGGGKRKMDSQVSRQDNGNNGKKNKNGGQNGGNNNNRGGPPPAQIPRFREYTPLTEIVTTVFNQAEHRGIFNYPPGIRTPANKRDNTKYCRFHRDTGHTTEECRVLKDEVEKLIQRGQLREYVRGANQQPRQPAQPVERP
ncbi:hypothetical protein UlMin_015343 [Ulmus minor]